jgi:hypothetical protein
MSRTFDVLERMQQDRALFRVPSITQTMPTSVTAPSGRVSSPDLASFTREEVVGLVQRLFLTRENTGGNRRHQVVFCGIDNIEGSNLLCARIGRILAEQVQSEVCVVDANVRTASACPLFDLFPLEDSSESNSNPTKGSSRRITDNLWLASGDSVSRNGASPTLYDVQSWLSGLPAEFAHLVISAPPIGLYADAAVLGRAADGVVLVLEANATRWRTVRKVKQALEDARVKVLGAVLNNRTFPIPDRIYRML